MRELCGKERGRVYDFFRNRAIFPIQSHFGDVIAFGGRVMDDSNPKYLNSGETYIFNKRYHLYALNLVKKQRNLNHIILMEGYMDVVALAGIGVKNAVASLGTALQKNKLGCLKSLLTLSIFVTMEMKPAKRFGARYSHFTGGRACSSCH